MKVKVDLWFVWGFFHSNILKLMNAFNLPENTITDSNYEHSLAYYNKTSPDIVQGLQIQTCDMQFFLSQVSGKYLDISLVMLTYKMNLFTVTVKRVIICCVLF